jgi:hypothetical protein
MTLRTSHRIIPLVALVLAAGHVRAQDTNANFRADSFDLRNGTSQDCNRNGVPDESDSDRPHFSAAVEHLNALEGFLSEANDVCPVDLDRDGRVDLAVISHPDPNFAYLTFWRNEGGPGLVYHSRITIGLQIGSIEAGDLNADGRLDLVISDTAEERVYVLRATGDFAFSPALTLTGDPSVNGTGSVALADLDNDGDIDIVSPQFATRTVCVFRNNGDATFQPRASYPADYTPWAAVAGDFTGDGFADIAVANAYIIGNPADGIGTVTLLRNTGDGTFVPHATLVMPTASGPFGVMRPRPRDLKLVDTDHDGDLDLIVSSDESQRLDLFTNDGSGVFTLAGAIGSGYYLDCQASRLECKDLDGNGWEDVAWCDMDAHTVSIFKNNAGAFAYRRSLAVSNHVGAGIAVADFTGDGRPDLATANSTSRTVSVVVNKGELDFDSALRLRPTQYPSQTMIGDFTSDGITDLAFLLKTQTATDGVGVFRGLGDGTFAATPTVSAQTAIRNLVARDVNHDGILDIVETVGRCNVFLGNGDGTFRPAISSPPIVLARNIITDINRDTHLDLVWISPGHPGSLHVGLGDGAGRFGPDINVAVVPAEDEEIAFGDVTGDGAPEIFTGHRQGLAQPGGVFCVYPNDGNGGFGPRQDRFIVGQPLSPPVAAIACADFDLDGDNDVVISAAGLRIYENSGRGDLPQLPILVHQSGASMLRVADIDLDGVPDLFGRAATGIVYLSDGSLGFDRVMFLQQFDSNARNMVVGDLNNDDRADLVIEPENSWDKYAFLNLPASSRDANGNGIPDECEDACAADFNHDGQADFFDYLDFAIAFDAQDPPADIDGNGQVDFFDYLDFVAAFDAGC